MTLEEIRKISGFIIMQRKPAYKFSKWHKHFNKKFYDSYESAEEAIENGKKDLGYEDYEFEIIKVSASQQREQLTDERIKKAAAEHEKLMSYNTPNMAGIYINEDFEEGAKWARNQTQGERQSGEAEGVEPLGFEMYSELNGKYVQINDRFETVHVWHTELAIRNKGIWKPIQITKAEYLKEIQHGWN